MIDSSLELGFPAVKGKTIVGRFDGGEVTSDAGVMLLGEADRKLGLTELMAGAVTDRRQQEKVEHKVHEMIRARVYAICLGYEDANDLDVLGGDPALKSACGRLPSDSDLASQPTISRLENAVGHKGLFVLGLATNKKLAELSTPAQMDAAIKYKWEGDGCREYGEFGYGAKTWARERRVIVKAEITGKELKPRYVVTNLAGVPQAVYEFYCGRGDQENRIKEMKLDLASGRTSCHKFLANQFRLLLHTAACVLMGALQEALEGTRWAKAQVGTLRSRLLKVGARVAETCRKVWIHLPTSFPEREAWLLAHRRLVSGMT